MKGIQKKAGYKNTREMEQKMKLDRRRSEKEEKDERRKKRGGPRSQGKKKKRRNKRERGRPGSLNKRDR